jgi:hypothetical protein
VSDDNKGETMMESKTFCPPVVTCGNGYQSDSNRKSSFALDHRKDFYQGHSYFKKQTVQLEAIMGK